MTRVTKFLATSSILALLAAPALAQGLLGGVDLNSTLKIESSEGLSADGKVGATADGEVTTEGATNLNADADAEAKAMADVRGELIGRGVFTNDGVQIGRVTAVKAAADADGKMRVIIGIEDAIQSEVRLFSMMVDADVMIDGDLKLGWSQAELMAALSAQAAAEASKG